MIDIYTYLLIDKFIFSVSITNVEKIWLNINHKLYNASNTKSISKLKTNNTHGLIKWM